MNHFATHIRRSGFAVALFALCMLSGGSALAAMSVEGQVPQAASALARHIDRQLAARLGQPDSPARGVSLAVTVPVNVNNLEESNPLARQVAEELSRWFVQSGYSVQELRKGSDVLIDPEIGEILLTRRANILDRSPIHSAAVLMGTYTITSRHVRFNIKMMHSTSRDLLGMATVSVPITSEIRPLLGLRPGGGGNLQAMSGIEPSVRTTLP
ncbi:hypothetical protein LJC23_01965 [Desulfovibrio sp. OttesenSCG-928-I05]|nr:hypothetical protein [Desulfovibrio sp. OttesenSCG-928-I05]